MNRQCNPELKQTEREGVGGWGLGGVKGKQDFPPPAQNTVKSNSVKAKGTKKNWIDVKEQKKRQDQHRKPKEAQ